MIRPDLHLHTAASDGIYTPSQLARLLQRADVTLFSVTDHDTLSGLPEAADAAYDRGLAFIPGVEISTEGDDEVHILGYGVRADDPVLNAAFAKAARDRRGRVLGMADRLAELGMPIDLEAMLAKSGASLGRPLLGRAMAEQGYVETVQEAFDKYLSKGKPAYLPRATMTGTEAVSLLRDRGAIPVLAHPEQIRWPRERLLAQLEEWIKAGLRGIEAYHPANRGHYAEWDAYARQRGLLVTGGSDFHDGAPGHGHGQLGETAAEWPNPCQDGWALYRAARK